MSRALLFLILGLFLSGCRLTCSPIIYQSNSGNTDAKPEKENRAIVEKDTGNDI